MPWGLLGLLGARMKRWGDHTVFFFPPSQLSLPHTPPEPSFRGLGQHPAWLSQASAVANPAALSPIEMLWANVSFTWA